MSVEGISDACVDGATGLFVGDVEQMLATSSGVATAGVDVAGNWLPGVLLGTIADSSSVAAGSQTRTRARPSVSTT